MKTKTAAITFTVGLSVVTLVIGIFTSQSIFAGPSGNATYVGASKCRKCHSKEFRKWQKTAHAKNFEILTLMGRDKDSECVKCHSTGYGEARGFVDVATTPNLAGTTCEACHGPGSEHITVDTEDVEKAKATTSLPTGACAKCHNPHEVRQEQMGKDALPVLKKKLEELQKIIAALEAK